MTTHTPAPAQQDFVATEISGIINVCGDSPTAIVSVERMRLWLSKLRAPVADEQEMSLAVALHFADFPRPYHTLQAPADTNGELYRALAVLAREYRAAQASAPVAGEARPFAVLAVHKNGEIRSYSTGQALADAPIQDHERELQRKYGYELVTVYAAPQASEAVPRAGYAGVTVWVGDRQATQIVTQQGLELSNKDELLERFEVARAALSAQPGAQKEGRDAE
ncbi:hypothetical protein [Achromobacter sp. ACRQX]|uniref:hypothetical protein n=1 Tax=Achromobacter sp. ACRQX TaxID=2918181 RepID=UPI001EF33B2B|nr:hypothetical protein [Achromobacter sp. ACRQX]MCG7328018.1 hypothetical protein [Achromobacter sp. ACRQX]